MLFVFTMLLMSASGAVMAALKPEALSVIAGSLTLYLVITGLLTVRPLSRGTRQVDLAAMLAALTIAGAGMFFGFEALNSLTGSKDGFPAPPYFVFATVALLGALMDMRMWLARGVKGAHRLARHLWRMCFALFIAAASFFLGQAQIFPQSLRKLPILGMPVLLVLLLMLYWLWRVLRARQQRPA